MIEEIIGTVLDYLGWGGMFAAPVAVFLAAINLGLGKREALLVSTIAFAAFLGWNIRGTACEAADAAELRRLIAENERLEAANAELVAEVESDRQEIRGSVDDAIEEIRRASEAARAGRGACDITSDELDGLRRALGFPPTGSSAGSAGKSGR